MKWNYFDIKYIYSKYNKDILLIVLNPLRNLNNFTSEEIKSDKSLNVFAFFNPQSCLILLYGGSPLSLPL